LAAGIVGGALAVATAPLWAPGYYGYNSYYPTYAYGPGFAYAPSYGYGYSPGYSYGSAWARLAQPVLGLFRLVLQRASAPAGVGPPIGTRHRARPVERLPAVGAHVCRGSSAAPPGIAVVCSCRERIFVPAVPRQVPAVRATGHGAGTKDNRRLAVERANRARHRLPPHARSRR
jgi:hypothetical protein